VSTSRRPRGAAGSPDAAPVTAPAMAQRIAADDVVAVIPARHGSSRFPGKALAPLAGRPLIAHVVAQALRAQRVGVVLVATDHAGIAAAARAAGAQVAMTRPDHPTGTDRIGEAIARRAESIVLNVQGDEPLVPPDAIDRLVELLEAAPHAAASTLACPLAAGSAHHLDPNVVKVVIDAAGRALYFSRAPIPGRHPTAGRPAAPALRHVGVYGFRRAALERFLSRPPTPLELAEGLEQLRLLELGEVIVVGIVESIPLGVDTPEDLARCAALLAGGAWGGAGAGRDVG
jgi:3-deoxy-manno-octulosonate cytidylyltransferase (CMP-KDO synthetase)